MSLGSGERMAAGEQLVTIGAVLLGALTSYVGNYLSDRSRTRYELLTRWDDRKLSAYEDYVDRMRTVIFLAVPIYEDNEGIRAADKPQEELLAEHAEAQRIRGRSFERIMLLGADDVIEAAHDLNAIALEIDWQATGKISGTLEEWRGRHRAVFRAINTFHDAARTDLGVQGSTSGEKHPERDLLLPPARSAADGS